ncbi:ABC transporter permease [Derxia gummosa]|uniref:ABC transporter permease n=1 Tax=Derxia gummosa DSM 723 TaxID=1121388 RepID=A0A8B6XB00_9BURK|nr:ABC transporter permease [Derxia gummosa]
METGTTRRPGAAPALPRASCRAAARALAGLVRQSLAGEWRAHPLRLAVALLAIAAGVTLGFAVHLVNASALDEFSTAVRQTAGSADLQLRGRGLAAGDGFDEALFDYLLGTPGVAAASPVVELEARVIGVERGARPGPAPQGGSGADGAPDARAGADGTPDRATKADGTPDRATKPDRAPTGDSAVGPRPARITLVGIDPLRALAVTPALLGQPAEGADLRPLDPDAVFLSAAAQTALGAAPGDRLLLAPPDGGPARRLVVAGSVPGASAGRSLAVVDIALAQAGFGRVGRLSRIDLRLAPGSNARAFAAGLALPGDVVAAEPAIDEQRGASLSRAYRVNLNMLALVALLTGGFLVYSVQSLAVRRRLVPFSLLRVIGASRAQVTAVVVAEGLLLGLGGAALGIAGGGAMAAGVLRLLGGDLGGGYFSGGTPALLWSWPAAGVFTLLGLGAALAGSLWPARAAGRIAPARGLKGIDDDGPARADARAASIGDGSAASGDGTVRMGGGTARPRTGPHPRLAAARRLLPGLALLAAGTGLAWLPPLGGIALGGYAAIAALLAGGLWLMPALAALLATPLGRLAARSRSPVLALASARVAHNPARAGTMLAGVVASFSLMAAMAIMVASFRHSVDDWLGQILPADVYLRLGASGGLTPRAEEELARLPGVASVEYARLAPLALDPQRPNVLLIARPMPDARAAAERLPLVEGSTVEPAPDAGAGSTATPAGAGSAGAAGGRSASASRAGTAAPIPIWVSEAMVDLYALAPGRVATLPLGPAGDAVSVRVAGVWRDYARQFGAIVIDRDRLAAVAGRHAPSTDAAFRLAAGAAAEPLAAALRARPDLDGADIALTRDIRALSLRIFDRSFAVTYLLEAVAVAVGLAGVATAFGAEALARAKEFGMLRHLGVARGQIVAMLAVEGALLATAGVLAGLALGAAIGAVLVFVVNPQSFHWTMQWHAPTGLLAGVAAGLVAAAALTAVLAAHRAASASAIAAVRDDI